MFDPLDFGASGLMEGLQFGHRLGWATGPSLVERRQVGFIYEARIGDAMRSARSRREGTVGEVG
jgi:hypothetical protein